MRSFSSIPAGVAPEIKTFAHRIANPSKHHFLSSAQLKYQRNTFKNSEFGSVSTPELQNCARKQSFDFKPTDQTYIAEILSRKDWYLLLNHEFKAQRLSYNTQVVEVLIYGSIPWAARFGTFAPNSVGKL